MIICDDEYPVIFDEIKNFLTFDSLELVFVENKQMQEINLAQRGIDKTTDVLSFPLVKIPNNPLGSIVINVELAKEVALKLGHSFEDEISLMFLHGVLHILGYDHEIDNGEMRAKECEVVEKFGLPKSLIVRVCE